MLRNLKLKARTSAQRKRFNYLAETVYAFKNYTIPRLHQEYVLSGGAGFDIYEDPDEEGADMVGTHAPDARAPDARAARAANARAARAAAEKKERALQHARELLTRCQEIKNRFIANDDKKIKNKFKKSLRTYIEAAKKIGKISQDEDTEELIKGELELVEESRRLAGEKSEALRLGMR